MTLAISSDLFLQFHVLLSLVGILAGFVVLYELLAGQVSPGWTGLFLALMVLTSATGFALPPFGFDPPRAVGVISLVLLAFAITAFYGFRLSGIWRPIYVGTAVAALYLDVFVAVTQAFQKVQVLQALAPNQNEPPFIVVQLVVLVAFIVLGILAAMRLPPGLRTSP